MTRFEKLIYEKRGPVALITLNRPQVLNALDVDLFAELRQALIEAEMNPDVQMPIITGAGRAFCSGADLKSVADHHESDRERWMGAYEYAEAADALFRQIGQMDKIVMAMVNGAAYAGGIVLACAADIAVASDRAVFRVPEGLVGIADELSTTWLAASIGLARAKYLILAAQEVTAAEACAMGLIAKVVPHETLWPETKALAQQVMRTGPRARAQFKHLLNDKLPQGQQRHIVASHLGAESAEGAKAFLEKRSPEWVPGDIPD